MWVFCNAILISHIFLYGRKISCGWRYFLKPVWIHYLEIKTTEKQWSTVLSPRIRINSPGTWTVTSPAAQLHRASCQLLLSLCLTVFSTLHSHQHTEQCVWQGCIRCTSASLHGHGAIRTKGYCCSSAERCSGSQSESKMIRPKKNSREESR